MNKDIKEMYEQARYPAALVDANSYILWANSAARETYPELFRRDGLRKLARFSDERTLISRLVRNGIGATLRPRQIGYTNLQLTFTPLPDTGKEMLLTVSADKKYAPCSAGFGAGIVACAAPAVRDAVAQVCDNIDLARGSDAENARKALNRALSCCSELVSTVDHMEMFAKLSSGGTPDFTVCDTAEYFSGLIDGVSRMLKTPRLTYNVKDGERLVIDHELMGRALLMLIANALEHGDGEISVNVTADEGELLMSVSNGLKYDGAPSQDDVVKPYFSFTEDAAGNDRIGIGLTVVDLAAKAHGGSIEVSSKEGKFEVSVRVPSSRTDKAPDAVMRTEQQYIADRFSPISVEMEKYRRSGEM